RKSNVRPNTGADSPKDPWPATAMRRPPQGHVNLNAPCRDQCRCDRGDARDRPCRRLHVNAAACHPDRKRRCMFSRRDLVKSGALALTVAPSQGAFAEEIKTELFKVITVKDEIVIGLSPDELKGLGGTD